MRLFLVAVAAVDLARCQNPWVRRNQKKDGVGKVRIEEDEEVTDALSEFERINQLVQQMGSGDGAVGRRAPAMPSPGDFESLVEGMGLDSMGDMWEAMMNMPEVKALLDDPEKLKSMVQDNPLLKMVPGMADQIDAALESDTFRDPAKLHAAMKEGVEAFKTVGQEFSKELAKNLKDMYENPEKISEALAELTAGAQAAGIPDMSQLFGGDLSPEQISEAMAEAQKLLGQLGLDPSTLGDLGALGTPAGALEKEL